MIKKMILCSGVPGSGKSFKIHQWMSIEHVSKDEIGEYKTGFKNWDYTSYNSTDAYWVRPDGRYDWNFKLIGEAHEWNRQNVEEACRVGLRYVVVDNTNLIFKEIRPYVEMAKKYGYEVEIVESDAPWRYDAEECAKRNTHGVPLETIKKMLAKRESVESLMQKAKDLLNA
jgi:hypothetical protein